MVRFGGLGGVGPGSGGGGVTTDCSAVCTHENVSAG